jgi:putative DNA primase/helicase
MFDPDMVGLFHEIIGYVLLPGLNLKKAIHFYSRETGTSKSTWLNVIGGLVGRENTTGISLQDLDDHRFHRASLQGKLLNSAGEIGSAAPKSSAVFKALVGGDPVPAEHKGDKMFMLHNTATMLFAGNMFANTHEQGDAYTSRWMIVPFIKQYAVNPDFFKTVSTPDELEGLLVHAVRGAARLLSRGGFPNPLPHQVEMAASKMALDLDSVARFSEECLSVGEGELDGAATYNLYRSWAEDAGLRAVGRPQFYLRMADRPGVAVVEGRARMKKIMGVSIEFPVVSNTGPEWRK